MTPLCSIVCPSRGRPNLLLKMIHSITTSASDWNRIEFCIRLHKDDIGTLRWIPQILTMAPNVRIVIGDPMRGYGDLSRFYEEALAIAKGDWIWVQNDDCTCDTKGWDEQLSAHATNHIIMPEIHRLGKSTYTRDLHCPFMLVPNRCWVKYLGDAPMRDPFDAGLWTLLREHDWPTDFMPGLCVHHDRKVPAEEDEERAMWEKINPEEQSRH
jgi:hypothetical protein